MMVDPIDPNAPPTPARRLSVCSSNALGPQKLNVLLVEPAMTPPSDRERLLNVANYCVTSVRDVREMFDLRFQGPIAFAVLNDLLGPFGMRAAAESVRRQWPLAKILVIGSAVPILEDHLYDETISHLHEKDELFDVLQVLAQDSQSQRITNGYAEYRRVAAKLSESDPTKRIVETPVQTKIPHDLPSMRATS